MSFYKYNLQRTLEKFREKHPENFEVVEDFAEDLLANRISELRVYSYVCWLRRFLEIVPKRLDQWERRDIRKVINHYHRRVEKEEISENTLVEVKKTLKKFFKWAGKEELVDWFAGSGWENKVSPNDLITEDEFESMLDACMNSRDKALLSLLYESGARIGEIGPMRIKDVSFDDYGAIVWLPKSKTVRRKLRVVYSVRYLSEWLSNHPLRDDTEAPLWIKLTGRNAMRAMAYDDIRTQIKKIAKRAGLKKRIHPHLFRHTRATRLLAKVPESVGAKYMGWVPGSNMVRVYVHLASEDVDEAILKLHGIKTSGNGQDLEVMQCPRCTMINPASSRFCSRCGLPLTEDAVLELENWEKRKAEAMKKMTDPEFLRVFMSLSDEVKRLKEEIERLRAERK